MGFYINVEVLNKERQKIGKLQTEKGGLGKAIFLFKTQDFKLNRGTREYFCETSVGEAIKNLSEVNKLIKEKTEETKKKYDKWSSEAINAFLSTFLQYEKALLQYNKEDIIFTDMSEGMLCFEGETLAKFCPETDYNKAFKFLNNIVRGNYNAYFLSVDDYDIADKVFGDIKRLLGANFSNVRRVCKDNINVLKIGDTRILEIKADIVFTKDEEDNREEWFYDSSNYLLPIFAYLQDMGRHMKESYEKVYDLKPDERGFKVYFYRKIFNN